MSEAVIIGGGDFPKKEYPRELIRRADVLVCCDGNALRAFLRHRKSIFGDNSREPDAVVGDMDSMSPTLSKRYSKRLVKVEEQDDNDQTKAFKFILNNFPDVDSIHILAATGKREDHTVGNLGLLMEYAREYPSIDMVSDYSTAFAVTDSCDLHLGEGRRFSFFTADNSLKVTSEGLQWPLDDVVFDAWWKATLNRTTEPIVSLHFNHPSAALVMVD